MYTTKFKVGPISNFTKSYQKYCTLDIANLVELKSVQVKCRYKASTSESA